MSVSSWLFDIFGRGRGPDIMARAVHRGPVPERRGVEAELSRGEGA